MREMSGPNVRYALIVCLFSSGPSMLGGSPNRHFVKHAAGMLWLGHSRTALENHADHANAALLVLALRETLPHYEIIISLGSLAAPTTR